MIGVLWTGWDGSMWDLARGPLRITPQTMEVLGAFDSDAFVSRSANVHGQRLEGWIAKEREFDLSVATAVVPRSAMEWSNIDAAWKRTMRPGRFGTLTVSGLDGTTRSLAARMETEIHRLNVDPSIRRRTLLTYGMVADDPWWYGPQEVTTFRNRVAPPLYFGETGFGPPFHIAERAVIDGGTLMNTGDEDAWPVWTFHGPAPRFSAAVNGRVVSGELPILDGEWVTVDTRPFRKSAIRSTGENITRELSSRRYTRIPAGANVDVDVALFGESKVTVTVAPQFFRGYN